MTIYYANCCDTDPLSDIGPQVLEIRCGLVAGTPWYALLRRPLGEWEYIEDGQVKYRNTLAEPQQAPASLIDEGLN